MSLCNKIKYLTPNIFRTRCCKPLIFQTLITWFNRIHSWKYLRSTTFGSKDIVIRKSKFVTKTQFLYTSYSNFYQLRLYTAFKIRYLRFTELNFFSTALFRECEIQGLYFVDIIEWKNVVLSTHFNNLLYGTTYEYNV